MGFEFLFRSQYSPRDILLRLNRAYRRVNLIHFYRIIRKYSTENMLGKFLELLIAWFDL